MAGEDKIKINIIIHKIINKKVLPDLLVRFFKVRVGLGKGLGLVLTNQRQSRGEANLPDYISKSQWQAIWLLTW